MIPIYICEDQPAMREAITRHVENSLLIESLHMRLALATADPAALLDAMGGDRGVYLLDVDLGSDMDGFALAQRIRGIDPRGYIVFITTHGELSHETFRYKIEAMDFILKDDPQILGERILECLQRVSQLMQQERFDQSKYYTVKVFDTVYNIPLRKILFFETSSQKHKVILHTDTERLEFFESLQAIEERIGSGFIRTHRSCLVNRMRIRAIRLKDDCVELDSGDVCPLSRKAKKGISL